MELITLPAQCDSSIVSRYQLVHFPQPGIFKSLEGIHAYS